MMMMDVTECIYQPTVALILLLSFLIRAYLVYVRPVVEYNTVVWSPYTIKDIETIEQVQRRFTKKLPGLRKFSYAERLSRLRLHSLELRRLLTDGVVLQNTIWYC